MPSASDNQSLSRHEWSARRDAHQAKVSAWADARVSRATVSDKDPIYDFLFTYYSFRPAHLKRWSPGANVALTDARREELDWPDDFVETPHGWMIPAEAFPRHRAAYLSWARRYLEAIQARPPVFCCFGLHEWAMVYKSDQPRHEQVPLRLQPDEIARVVERADLRCTHYDAFRFFTPEATPRNRTLLRRQTTTDFDQPGCVHVTMDLYKFAHKIAPWCPSELIADTFLLAADARLVDMRASPYDLHAYGCAPIRIELPEGREEYIAEQRRLAELAVPLRSRLLEVYKALGAS